MVGPGPLHRPSGQHQILAGHAPGSWELAPSRWCTGHPEGPPADPGPPLTHPGHGRPRGVGRCPGHGRRYPHPGTPPSGSGHCRFLPVRTYSPRCRPQTAGRALQGWRWRAHSGRGSRGLGRVQHAGSPSASGLSCTWFGSAGFSGGPFWVSSDSRLRSAGTPGTGPRARCGCGCMTFASGFVGLSRRGTAVTGPWPVCPPDVPAGGCASSVS